MTEMSHLHREIIKILHNKDSSYANPIPSDELGQLLHVNPSYIREQMKHLLEMGRVLVRNGPGGGYFLNPNEKGALNDHVER